ncbi:XdhC family protein [Methylobacterium brachiatum]|uniref:Xanthine dehydrogenase accessory factor n=1 Tax=Methylobacterium brachiatum TaxID=269660 RepID=A0AAJ1U1H2_9HYPH|nr:XdhC family protein [Methylobacterium brachiatum]MCB4806514.1 XdhC family protein [Methylobacterium brachiatum]MDQ0547568.1 xanthine dehydrogenase accessory factor [Methylobacterium brachiatum]
MRTETLEILNAERAARRATILVTDLADGSQRLVREAEIAADPLAEVLRKHLASGKSGLVEIDGRQTFLTVQVPPVRLVVIGAVHISQAMAPMVAGLDLALTVIDPRTAFASPDRFPGVELVAEWPDAALGGRVPPLDRYCALAALTHDPKIDDPALKAALTAECFYVGALGSRKTHAARTARLAEAGFSPEQIGRIRAPIGLAIGAVSPAEIALAVLAEIVAALRRVPRPEVA